MMSTPYRNDDQEAKEDAELEALIEAHEKATGVVEEQENQDEIDEQEAAGEAPQDGLASSQDDESWKKRYGDLRRHSQQREAEMKKELDKIKNQLSEATKQQIKFPKSDEEIAQWVEKYPDVAAIVDTIAQRRALEASATVEKQLSRVQQLEEEANRQKAEAALARLHPDFSELREDPDFHAWAEAQPKWVRTALYESDDPEYCAAAIDRFKSQRQQKKPTKKAGDKEAAQSVSKPSATDPVAKGGKTFKESQIEAMSPEEFERHEDEIMKAFQEGRVIMDAPRARSNRGAMM